MYTQTWFDILPRLRFGESSRVGHKAYQQSALELPPCGDSVGVLKPLGSRDSGSTASRAKSTRLGLHLSIEGSPPESIAYCSFSGGFSLQSKLSPRCDLLELSDRPNLNSAKRARSLSTICISKVSNLARIRSTDAMA
ncbi:hypothetical protein GW17_00031156 [Ensete ventricosum]|nr:hypothetical protein GW17_00031156 [Ensete ventricosum]